MKRIFLSIPLPCNSPTLPQYLPLLPLIDGLHLDIMDGNLVPTSQGSAEEVQTVRSTTTVPLWIHAMVNDPASVIRQLWLQRGDIISIHYEHAQEIPGQAGECHFKELAQLIIEHGAIPSCALSPATPVLAILPLLPYFHHILLMTVTPGKSGQVMLSNSVQRYDELKRLISNLPGHYIIGLDGGLNPQSLQQFSFTPEDDIDLAASTGILNAQNPSQAILEMRQSI